jgi:hypothetical protein
MGKFENQINLIKKLNHIFPKIYSFRNCLLVSSQIAALLIVTLADSTSVALVGVMFSSFASGFGEMTYSALTALYPR